MKIRHRQNDADLLDNTLCQVSGRFLLANVDGQIDSVSVWNDVLTAGELIDLYNSGTGLDY